MMIERRVAVCVFYAPEDARDAVAALKEEGFPPEVVSLLAPEAAVTPVDKTSKQEKAREGALTGAVAGGLFGGLAGWLVGLGTLAIRASAHSSPPVRSRRRSVAPPLAPDLEPSLARWWAWACLRRKPATTSRRSAADVRLLRCATVNALTRPTASCTATAVMTSSTASKPRPHAARVRRPSSVAPYPVRGARCSTLQASQL
jgi:hypothetical protein